jgi:UDP-glucuronate 4-epimerase
MTILITGCAGFIGMHMAKYLLEQGEDVFGIDNLNDYYDPNLKMKRLEQLNSFKNFSFEKMDIADGEALKALFLKTKPKKVINLAAQAGVRYSILNPYVYTQSNLVGFSHILENCRQFNVEHLIHSSSSSVYGMNSKVPFSVADSTDNPVSYYAATKKSNEVMASSYSYLYGLKITCLRYFTVYGPWGRPDMSPWLFTKSILDKKAIKVFNFGNMMRDYTFVDDIVEGTFLALNRKNDDLFKIYNLGNNQPVKLIDFIETLEKQLGIKAEKDFQEMQAGDVYETYADITETKKDLRFNPKISVEDGVREWVEWYKSYHHL